LASDPLILAFDTSAAHCAAALLSGGRIIASRFEPMTTGQAEHLMVLLEDVLAEGGVGWRELDAIGVGVGPGNFTGIRIAVSAARGLALGLEVPAIGISTFDALRQGLPDGCIASVAAPRDMVYVSVPFHDPAGPFEVEALRSIAISAREPKDTLVASAFDVVGASADHIAEITAGEALAPKNPIADAIALRVVPLLGVARPLPAPLYVRSADAAPSSDKPPVLLD